MRLTFSHSSPQSTFSVLDMDENSYAIVVSDFLYNEVIYRNMAGWHGLTSNLYWSFSAGIRPNMQVRLLKSGDCLTLGDL
jgi:hypothetical protein